MFIVSGELQLFLLKKAIVLYIAGVDLRAFCRFIHESGSKKQIILKVIAFIHDVVITTFGIGSTLISSFLKKNTKKLLAVSSCFLRRIYLFAFARQMFAFK